MVSLLWLYSKMKNLYFIFLSILFFSCNNREKYNSEWHHDFLNSFINEGYPSIIDIKDDSITITHPFFKHNDKYSVKIKSGKMTFNDISIKSRINNDTLYLNDAIKYIRNFNDENLSVSNNIITEINLPNLSGLKSPLPNKFKYYNHYVYYGKRLGSNEFVLQLNDQYAKFDDLIPFINVERSKIRHETIPFFSTILYMDKKSKTQDLDNIIMRLKLVNQLKIKFVNNIDLKFDESHGLYYEDAFLKKILFPEINQDYYHQSFGKDNPPPFPPPPVPDFSNDNRKIAQFLLIKDKIYYNDTEIKLSKLSELLNELVNEDYIVFTLYDLDSHYGKFLELIITVDYVYYDLRNKLSLSKYGKPLNDLNRDELAYIKSSIPMRHTWDFSIPHYNSIVKKEGTFYGLEVDTIDLSL